MGDASMEIFRRCLSKATVFVLCAPLVLKEIAHQVRKKVAPACVLSCTSVLAYGIWARTYV